MKPSNQFITNLTDKNDFNQEIKETISSIFDDNVSEKDIQFFLQLASTILEEETKSLIKCYQKSVVPDIPQNISKKSTTKPYSINIIMYQNPPQNINYYQPYLYTQQYANPAITQNTSYLPSQLYQQISYPQQPIYPNNSLASFPYANKTPKHSKKSKKEKSKKDKKSEKKDKKTKKEEKSTKSSKSGLIVFKHDSSKEFDGIINYLTKKTGGNIHKNGTINITASSVNRHSFNSPNPENCVDLTSESTGYKSSNEVLSWISFDFKERKIELNSYSILSNNSVDFGQLRNWVIEVSNDEKNWTIIDEHKNDSTLKKEQFTATFDVQKKKSGFYRYIRLNQTGDSWHMNGSGKLINIPKIEFYGKLKE